MRKDFIFDLEPFLPIFSKLELDVEFLTPTKTAYHKSIIDAIIPVRDFLKRNKLHDYEKQCQGNDYKKYLPTFFVTEDRLIKTKTSLYRPVTKDGDPRIWFYRLTNYCNPGDLLALVTDKKSIYVMDLSLESIRSSLLSGGYVYNLLKKLSEKEKRFSKELLSKIQRIHDKGFVPTIKPGDTGIGMTLEHLLGIPPNSSKNPDYKGIEIKASRMNSTRTKSSKINLTKTKNNNRVTLFSQVPNWKNSKGMTAEKLLEEYGYCGKDKKGKPRFNLYCTVKSNEPNSQGLYFYVDFEKDILINRSLIEGVDKYVLQWSLETLRNRLQVKHRETFWVKAESKIINGIEHFNYHSILHTKKPNVSLFPFLLDSGVITMDYVMHRKPDGKVRDHGYLFKINPSEINQLFPDPVLYDLNKNSVQKKIY